MGLGDFFGKQFIDVIQWTEADEDVLSFRYPMKNMEIQNGAKLTVRESQMAAFVNEGRVADVFGPGLHTLNTNTLPLLTNLLHWDKAFESPFKSDVYFFSTRIKLNQRWGTRTPITIRDKEFGAVRLRGYGVYAWHIQDPRLFHTKISGTRDVYRVGDIEGQLRNTVVGRLADTFGESEVPFLDMAANQVELAAQVAEYLKPSFTELGLELDGFVVENLSLPKPLQEVLDRRVGMNIAGDLQKFTQYQVADSIPIAAANEGGLAGAGAGLGAGLTIAQQIAQSVKGTAGSGAGQASQEGNGNVAVAPPAGESPGVAPAAETKFCIECGAQIQRRAKFCSECGTQQ